ncbi:MAG: hypothetical protein NZ730_06520 [Porticoccaceae bacterium]|nr:hypothetical protein [Porticoccaceae bacterium]
MRLTLIVTDADKESAEQVINDLYADSVEVSTQGAGMFPIELTDGTDTFWACTGQLYRRDSTALINSDLLYYVSTADAFSTAVGECELTIVAQEPELGS